LKVHGVGPPPDFTGKIRSEYAWLGLKLSRATITPWTGRGLNYRFSLVKMKAESLRRYHFIFFFVMGT